MKLLRHITIILSVLYVFVACGSEGIGGVAFDFYTAEEFSDKQEKTILDTARIWNELSNCNLLAFAGSYPAEIQMNEKLPSRNDLNDGINTIYFTNTGDNLISLAGLTIPTSNSDTEDIEMDMFILWNNTWEERNTLYWVVLHEFGHWLGLRHISSEEDPDSIMRPITPDVIPITITPSARDIAIVHSLWQESCQNNEIFNTEEYSPLFETE